MLGCSQRKTSLGKSWLASRRKWLRAEKARCLWLAEFAAVSFIREGALKQKVRLFLVVGTC